MEWKLNRLFSEGAINWEDPTVKNLMNIIESIDSKIDSETHSIFFAAINCVIAQNQKVKDNWRFSMMTECFVRYYKLNIEKSNFLKCMLDISWQPETL